MKRLLTLLIAVTAAVLTLVSVHPASAQGPDGGVVVNDQYTLGKDQVHRGNLTVIARQVVLEAGSRVDGNLSIVSSGPVTLNGEVNGNVSVLAPNATLASGLRVNGNLSICVREVSQSPGAVISGDQSAGCDQLGAVFSGRDSNGIRQIRNLPFGGYTETPLLRLFRVIVMACAIAALAALVMLFFPRHIGRITETATDSPITTGLVGFVSIGVALAITAVYLLSIVLTVGVMCLAAPIVAALWVAVFLALLLGWIAVAVPLGRAIAYRLKVHPTPMVTAALGALALTLLYGVIDMIPCIGWLSWVMLVVLGSVGFGAVLLTRFGTRPYPEIVTAHVVRPTVV